ncbi:MAG: hypothetical protein Q8Q04_01525 [archaeon]|nr:hypothetical protein [archaeon]
MGENKLKTELSFVEKYLERKKISNNLGMYGKSLFYAHLRKFEPKEYGKSIEEKIQTFTNFRNFFEEVICDLSDSDPFQDAYKNEVDSYFQKLHEKLGLSSF